jgi:hypothetical protein
MKLQIAIVISLTTLSAAALDVERWIQVKGGAWGPTSANLVNAFCHIDSRRLDTEWVVVYDGGACYFSAKYDPTAKRVYDIEVNGVG